MPKKRAKKPRAAARPSAPDAPKAARDPEPPGDPTEAGEREQAISTAGDEGPTQCLVVGVGASAGGIEAFSELLRALSPATEMAFVLVQHLAPARASLLAEIMSRVTAMPVTQIEQETPVTPNHVYVIPPGQDVTISDGVLRLSQRNAARSVPRPVDTFFRSLAQDAHQRAIGVVLSGTGEDGTLGLQEIKAEGGITFAQDETAQYEGMPRSAVASGCVDFVLPPEQIAQELARIARHPYVHPYAEEAEAAAEKAAPDEEAARGRILRTLRNATGVDFRNYKATTLNRRIKRRTVLHKLEGFSDYARFLQKNPDEAQALFQDILIDVTSFFRNPEAFEAIRRKVLPKLFKQRPREEPLRVWVLGCSTGEEAYSLAMLFAEAEDVGGRRQPVQVFASDLNESGIEKARAGVYSKSIVQDVSPDRLRRFFTEMDGSFRINKSIRDMCVFARQNVLSDPPFSRIDLISCRNLLIYLEPVLQQRVVSIFHYALKPAGFLVLGQSETIGVHREFFELLDTRNKIYVRLPGSSQVNLDLSGGSVVRPAPARMMAAAAEIDVRKEADRALLSRFAPPGVLINSEMEILEFRGDTSPFVMPAPGKASLNLLKMVREGLLVALRTGIHRANKERSPVRIEDLRVRFGGRHREVHLDIIPVRGNSGAPRVLWVLFEEAEGGGRAQPKAVEADGTTENSAREEVDEQVGRLTRELEGTRQYLQAVIEQQDAANEELQSANEEAQSANEELQSINEELETSKEEIQSTNEELATVNDELHTRNLELGQANNDLINLFTSVEMPMVILGRDLRIRRFTPAAEKLLNLISADVGRPVSDIRFNFDMPDLEPLLLEVMDTLKGREHLVQDKRGRWYSLRLRPYRTMEDKIDGAVLVLIDVDTLKRAQAYAERIITTVREPFLVLDADLRVRTASRSFHEKFQVPAEQTVGRVVYQIGEDGGWNIPELHRLLEEALPRTGECNDVGVEHVFKQVGRKVLLLNARRFLQDGDSDPLILLGMEDVTERTRLEETLKARVAELDAANRSKNEFMALLAHELRNPLSAIGYSARLLDPESGLNDASRQARDVIVQQVRKMTRLIGDLFDVSRIAHGKIRLRKEPVELAALLERVLAANKISIESQRLQVEVSVPPEPVFVDADPIRLEQIFDNLVNNATRYNKAGGRIRVVAGVEGGEVVVRVSDDGVGLATEQLKSVFDMFVQVESPPEAPRDGLGVGLSLAKKLVELHGGSIEAASQGSNQGCEFVVRLPGPCPAPHPLPAPPPAGPAPAKKKHRILVVDDHENAAELLAVLLRRSGHDVCAAFDGPSAVDMAASFRPDIVLLDIGMPKMSGYEVARWIREQSWGTDMVLVAVTGWGDDGGRSDALEAGFDGHLVKPVDYDDLLKLLDDLQPETA